MADPTRFDPEYSYSGYQASNPTRPLPAPQIDNDFANIQRATDETIDALAQIRRSDGQLNNEIITRDALESSLDALIAAVPGLADGVAASAEAAAGSAAASATSAVTAVQQRALAEAAASRALENASGLLIADEPTAIAGVNNDKAMTALRTRQATVAYIGPQFFVGDASGGDDTAKLAAAVASAIAFGGRVKLGSGVFLVRDWAIPNGAVITGDGISKTMLKRIGTPTNAPVTFAAGAGDVSFRDLTLDGNSNVDAKSMVSMGAHGSNIEFRNVKFQNCGGRWALRGDPATKFSNFKVVDCEFENCPIGCVIILAASMDARYSNNIEFIGNKSRLCGGNLFGVRDYETGIAANDRWDFYRNVKFNFNTITECTNTGTDGPIPNELWACKGIEQIGNIIDTGTRGLSAGAGLEDGVIAFNIIRNQTAYAMESGRARSLLVTHNIVTNCKTFFKDTGSIDAISDNIQITDNIISGTGLAAYDAITPADVIAFGNNATTNCNNIIVARNRFYDLEFARSAIRYYGKAGSTILIENNRYDGRTYNSTPVFIQCSGFAGVTSRRNYSKRTADYDSSHYLNPLGSIFYKFAGTLAAAELTQISENDTAEMTGAILSGTLRAFGESEGTTARYGLNLLGFKLVGNWPVDAFVISDSSGTTVIEGVDLSRATTIPVFNLVNSSLLFGLATGEFLIRDGVSVVLGAAKKKGRRLKLHYEGSVATRTIKITCNQTSGGQTPAVFSVDFVCTQNNSAPQANRVTVAWGNVSSPANAPLIFQGNGTAATVATALNGSLMEATITLPASNNNFMVAIDVELNGRTRNFSDYSVRIA